MEEKWPIWNVWLGMIKVTRAGIAEGKAQFLSRKTETGADVLFITI